MKSFRSLIEAKMSRQHFQLIADVIASLEISTTIKKTIGEKFADALESTNPGFKRDYFIKAARDTKGATDRIMKIVGTQDEEKK
tara:strand:+ start:345 stop:596 length:252 start_codon:yes stop_codon:yes gene_type:complete